MDYKQLAETILEKAKSRGADMAECNVSRETLTEIDSNTGEIQLVRSVAGTNVSIKVITEQRKGTISLNRTDEKSIDEALDHAFKNAKESAPDPAEGISDEQHNGTFQGGKLEPDRDRLFTLLDRLLNDVQKEFPHLKLETATIQHKREDSVYTNTNGVFHQTAYGINMITCMFSGNDGENAGSFNYFGIFIPDDCENLLELDGVRRLFGEAEKQVKTETIGEETIGDVVFSPECFTTMLLFAKHILLGDLPLISGTTPLKDKLGQKIVSDKLTWRANPLDERFVLNQHVTNDGYIVEDNLLIEKGVLKNYALSRYGAKASDGKRSGNISDMYVVEPGERSIDEIISGIKRGILVNRFSGGQPASNGDFSGVAKNSFLIEDGKITKALNETMISGNLIELLQNIEALSSSQHGDGARLVPWAQVKGINVTG